MKHRTFIAVPASPEIRRAALRLIETLRPAAGEVKWIAPENLHWTLQFLGDVDELHIPEVCTAVSKAADEIEPFALAARGAGAFPAPDRPRTLWLGAGDGAREMVALQKAIQRRLAKRGYRGEQRRYVPHLTVGRAGRNSSPKSHAVRGSPDPALADDRRSPSLSTELAKLSDYEAGTTFVDEVTVYASRLGRDGSTYEPLGRLPLGG
jgi:RNA 2',3'-cyclic 3'-phosphodiesterase